MLNNWKVALDLCRYNHQHDEVLGSITELVKEHITDDMTILADPPE